MTSGRWLVAGVLGALFCVNLFAPEVLLGLVPGCPFRTLTGRDCPGCGSTRAISALARGDLAAAWGFNRLTVSAAALLPLGILLRRLRRARRAAVQSFHSRT